MGMGNIEYLTSIVMKEMQVLTRGQSALTKLVKIKSNDSGGGAGMDHCNSVDG